MSTSIEEPPFSGWRSILWPVYRQELKKLLPMFFMLFLICFNYSVLRTLKDSVVITAKGSGADIIPFLKVWGILPGALLFTWLFTKLMNRLSMERVFCFILLGFVGYFLLFAFAIYPRQEFFEASALASFLSSFLPKGAHGFITMVQHWSLSIFYIIAELWTTVVMAVLFWGFANEITPLAQAKRFYGVLNVASAIATVAASHVILVLSQHPIFSWLSPDASSWEHSFRTLILIVAGNAFLVMGLLRWMIAYVVDKPKEDLSPLKPKKTKLSMRKSFGTLAQSKYLIAMAVLVVAYNLSINIVEVLWKDKVRELYPDAHAFNTYLAELLRIMGILSTITAILIPFIVTRIGWTFMAMMTPVIMTITAAGFFAYQFFPSESLPWMASLVFGGPLATTVFFGSCHNVLSKAAKYSVFDASKELAFIPLSHEERTKGKAAIDGVGSRLGKSGGAIIQQGLLLLFGSLSACAPWIAGIVSVIIAVWTFATLYLGKAFKEKTHEVLSSSQKPLTSKQGTGQTLVVNVTE